MHEHENEILELMMLIIAACYFIIAIQFYTTLRNIWGKVNKRAAISIGLLMAVFVLCGLAGYAGRSLGWSDGVELALHIILIGCSIGFIVTNQISVILHGLTDGND